MKVRCVYKELVDIKDLRPHPKHRNKHPKKQIEALANIVRETGWRRCLNISNQSGYLTVGRGRMLMAEYLHEKYPDEGWNMVPVDRQDYDSEAQEYADVQADNAIALWAELDIPAIKLDIKEFPDLKLETLGIEKLQTVAGHTRAGGDDGSDAAAEPIVKRGEVWQLGDHRLMCGDSTKRPDLDKLMDGQGVDMVFTSPPYNVGIKYNGHDDLMPDDQYLRMIEAVVGNCFAVMKDGRLIGWNVGVSPKSKPYQHAVILEYAGFKLFRHIVWKKTGAQIPLWQNSKKKPVARNYLPNYNHEMVYMMVKGQVEHGAATDMPEDLSMDVWDVSQFAAGGNNHPAAFPVHLAEMAIKVMSAPGEIAFEPFCGSGSTIMACEKSGRRCFAMEIDPHYCDVTIARWEKLTGKRAEKVG